MTTTLELRSDGYYYATAYKSTGEGYLEYFYENSKEALKKFVELSRNI